MEWVVWVYCVDDKVFFKYFVGVVPCRDSSQAVVGTRKNSVGHCLIFYAR